MSEAAFQTGDTVEFRPGPRSTNTVRGTVIGTSPSNKGDFLITRDEAGEERKVRPAVCQKVG